MNVHCEFYATCVSDETGSGSCQCRDQCAYDNSGFFFYKINKNFSCVCRRTKNLLVPQYDFALEVPYPIYLSNLSLILFTTVITCLLLIFYESYASVRLYLFDMDLQGWCVQQMVSHIAQNVICAKLHVSNKNS